jgi:protein SCO1
MIPQTHPRLRSQTHCPARFLTPAAVDRRHGILVRRVALAGAALLLLAASGGFAHDADEASAAANDVTRSMRKYPVPAVNLVRDDDKVVSLPDEMNDGRPVVLNFIFTTCTSICPLMSSVLAQFDRRLGPDSDKVHLMSISIDPEQDTPARLREYAGKFHPGRAWQHYTGTLEASIAAQRAFDVYRGAKMSHNVVTLMRAAPGKPWLRIEGFVTADDLVRDYRKLVASR